MHETTLKKHTEMHMEVEKGGVGETGVPRVRCPFPAPHHEGLQPIPVPGSQLQVQGQLVMGNGREHTEGNEHLYLPKNPQGYS